MRLWLIIALLLSTFGAQAATRITGVVTATNNTDTGDTFVVNSDTRIWTNSTTSATIATNSTGLTSGVTTNLFLAVAQYRFTGPPVAMFYSASNAITFIAPWDQPLVISAAGNWATITLSTQTVTTTYTGVWPFPGLPNQQTATNQASAWVEGMDSWSTNSFNTNGSGRTVLTNFVDIGPHRMVLNQSKQLFGGIYTNATGYFIGGSMSNGVFHTAKTTNAINYGNAFYSVGGTATSLQIGNGASATTNFTTSVGDSAVASARNATAVGTFASAGASNSVSIGASSEVSAFNGIALGRNATINSGADNSMAIGQSATVDGDHTNSIAFGHNTQTTETNQIFFGNSAHKIYAPGIYWGPLSTNAYLRGTNRMDGEWHSLRTAISSLATGNNIVDPGRATYLQITGSPGADSTIVGITNSAPGRVLYIENLSGFALTLAHESGVDPSPGNRINNPQNTSVSIINEGWAKLHYDDAASRWKTAWVYPESVATNAVADLNGLSTNLTVYASDTSKIPLTINPLTGSTNRTLRVNDTNGSAVVWIGTNNTLTATGNVQTGGTNESSHIWLTNSISYGLTVLPVDSAVTNYVVNFSTAAQVLALSTNMFFIHSTNRPGGSAASPERVVEKSIILESGLSDRKLYWNSNWKFLGAPAPSTFPSNKVAVLSFSCYGINETNVLVGWSLQP